ncbi:MAG: twin-arginine translocase subunit TatC [Anaerolineales bacterium]|nr:twin-arginine translocase subunit TatC [Anaerolineales bacterium]
MRRVGAILKGLILAPIRALLFPFQRFNRWLSQEPEETAAAEAIGRAFSQPGLLVEHLAALRGHLIRSAAVFMLATIAAFAFAASVVDWMAKPIGGIGALQAIEVTESVSAFMRVSLMCGAVIALPYIGFELFAFINPGLTKRERTVVLISVPLSLLLLLTGMAFAYYVMLPVALPFLLNFMGITTIPRPSNYIRFVTGTMFWMGVTFQTPLVVYILAMIGLVTAGALRRSWRYAIVGIAVLAAAITPTVDPVNMGLVMGPMIVLFFLSIGMASLAERSRRRRQARPEAP